MDALARLLTADVAPPRRVDTLAREIIGSASLDVTFAFFADAANLQRLTPAWLHFRILTAPPIEMRAGVEIAYRISLYGMPIPWRSVISVWEPGVRFVDQQRVGPYRWWRHEHRFEAVDGGTRVMDRVDYAPRMAWFSRRLVRRDLRRIFDYRHDMLRRIFEETGRSTTRA